VGQQDNGVASLIVTGQAVELRTHFGPSGSPVTTGTATVRIYRWSNGRKEYLQSDLSTFSTTLVAHSMSVVSDYWMFSFTLPTSAEGYRLEYEAIHSDTGLARRYGSAFIRPVTDTELTYTTTAEASTSPATTSHRHVAGTDITQVLTLDQYKREVNESFRSFDTGATPKKAYVRDSSGLAIKGKCRLVASRSNFRVTYNGVTYSEGTGANVGKILDGSGNVVGTITEGASDADWECQGNRSGAGNANIPPGTETSSRTLEVLEDGQIKQSATVVVDRTAPVITTFAHSGMTRGTAAGTPMRRGEYVRWTWTVSDASSGVDTRVLSQPSGSYLTSPANPGADSGTSSYTRTSSSAPTSGTRTLRLTVTDKAGNTATADLTHHFESLPALSAPSSPSVASSNQSPKSLFNADRAETSYPDSQITAGCTIPNLSACRNSGTDNTSLVIINGTLTVSGTTRNSVAGATSQTGLTATASSQASALGRDVKFRVTDQHYQTADSAAFGNFDYNAEKANDFTSDPGLVSPFAGLNKVNAESFYDADTPADASSRGIITGQATSGGKNTTGNAKIEGGFAKKVTAGQVADVQVRVAIPTNRASNNQYGIKLRGASGELGAADGMSVAWRAAGSSDAYVTVTIGAAFTGPTGATALDVRISWSASATPDVEAAYLGFIE
jgi:hypothetical protein